MHSTSSGEQSSWSGMPHFLPPDCISGTHAAQSGSSANSAGFTPLFTISSIAANYTKPSGTRHTFAYAVCVSDAELGPAWSLPMNSQGAFDAHRPRKNCTPYHRCDANTPISVTIHLNGLNENVDAHVAAQ